MKRVAYVTPSYVHEAPYMGAGERYPLNLAKAVAGTGGYEVEIVSYGELPTAGTMALDAGVTLRVLPAAHRRGQDSLSWEILSAIRDADLVHIHHIFSRSSEVAMLVAKLLDKPVCATDHGGARSTLGRSLGMLELADRVTCYSQFGGSLIETKTQIDLVPGGVDDEFFSPPTVPVARDRLLFVGRLVPAKGIDRLIAALPLSVPLSICGQPCQIEYLQLLCALAADKDVEFLTELNDEQLREMYRRAIGVVLPSVYVDCYGGSQPWPELMGFPLLEGMSCGAPAICSRVGGMPEYVEHEVTGFVFDGLAQLTSYIERLAADADLVLRLGGAGRRQVQAKYGLSSAGIAMTRVYDELLAARVMP